MDEEDQDPPSAEEECLLCPECMAGNLPDASFCQKCGLPLNSYASTAPLERIWATGHIYGNAINRPARLISVIGIWLLFYPHAVIFAYYFFSILFEGHFGFGEILWLIFSGLATLFCVYVLGIVTMNYLRRRT